MNVKHPQTVLSLSICRIVDLIYCFLMLLPGRIQLSLNPLLYNEISYQVRFLISCLILVPTRTKKISSLVTSTKIGSSTTILQI